MLSTSRVVQLKSVSAGPGDIEFILIPWSLYISCSVQDIASRDVWVWFDLSPAYLTGAFGVSSHSVFCSRIDWEAFSNFSIDQTCRRDHTQ